MFRYLNVGLSAVMTFVGAKMIVEQLFRRQLEEVGLGQTPLIFASLAVIALILGTTVVASLLAGPEKKTEVTIESVSPETASELNQP